MEFIKFHHIGFAHLKDFYTWIDLFLFTVFTLYFFQRLKITDSLLPNEYLHDVKKQKVVDYVKLEANGLTVVSMAEFSIVNLILYLAMGMKIMSFMRFISNLGQLEFLIG